MAGIYVHIPFCIKKCGYCDFYSVGSTLEKEALISALKKDLNLRKLSVLPYGIESVYFGGGTPSLYNPLKIGSVLETIKETFDCNTLKETTIEVNPEDITKEYVSELRETGINRISIGIQSFDDEMLKFMRRRHTASKGIEAVKLLQDRGFDNISVDLIYGLPNMTDIEWRTNIKTALSLNIQHISAYHLTIEKGTYFGKLTSSGKLNPVDDKTSTCHYETLLEMVDRGGFSQYEISNYSIDKSHRSLHNSNYWNSTPYLGVGPSAHSFDGNNCREWVVSSIAGYIKKVNSSGIYTEKEYLNEYDKLTEYIMLSLRKTEGMNLKTLQHEFQKYTSEILKSAQPFIDNGQIILKGDLLRINQKDLLISDYIISQLLP